MCFPVAAADGNPAGLRIGLPAKLFGNAPELDPVVRDALAELEAAGAELIDVSIPDFEWWLLAWLAVATTEVGNYVRAGGTNHWLLSEPLPSLAETLEESIRERGEELGDTFLAGRLYAEQLAGSGGPQAYALAHRARERLADGVNDALGEVDVLASTTVPMPAPRWDEPIEDVFGALANTAPFNVSGHPAVSVPCGRIDGLPVGLQFVGEPFGERAILEATAHWDGMYDWERPEPAV